MKTSQMEVKYVDHMGSDERVVDAARVSFAKVATNYSNEQNAKLIQYLAAHNHWSPMAHPQITLHVKAPIFVARQLVKHCVTGDTEVTFCKPVAGKSNGRIKRTIEELHRMWTGKVKYQGGKKGKIGRAHV